MSLFGNISFYWLKCIRSFCVDFKGDIKGFSKGEIIEKYQSRYWLRKNEFRML